MQKPNKVTASWLWLAGLLMVLVFWVTRLANLTVLPVFADEAIYIRWAQIIDREPEKYAFLPLYDGKSPLFIWILIPFLNLTPLDPLFSARLVSGLAGFVTLGLLVLITRALRGSIRAQFITAGMAILLPFTLFHDRMALIDTTLTTFLTLSFWCLLQWRNSGYRFMWAAGAGIAWGLALMTKTSAFYAAIVPWIFFLYVLKIDRPKHGWRLGSHLLAAGMVGILMLAWMRISPLFPFLFQRSSDFAFTPKELLFNPLHILSLNGYRIGKWLLIYLTPGFWILMGLFAVLFRKLKSNALTLQVLLLLSCCFAFLLPFLLTGRLLSSRYFLPVIIWLIPAGALIIDKGLAAFPRTTSAITGLMVLFSVLFALPLITDPGRAPFAHEDKVQYLTEWSSGYGIPEVRDFILQQAQDRRVFVATEGYFGTLPDGLLMYFDRSPAIGNVEIYGIGQPISGIDGRVLDKTAQGDVYLVVNQHRFLMETPPANMQLIGSYARPLHGPALLFYKILAPAPR